MKTGIKYLIVAIVILNTIICMPDTIQAQSNISEDQTIKVIFETDMGNDIDDALALDMLYKYVDQKKVDLLAISTNKNNEYSARYIDIMNSWYGYPSIPVGEVKNGADSEGNPSSFPQIVCEYEISGEKVFKETHNKFLESVNLYRRILAKQPDKSVVIISVGFSTNLARLLDSPADEYSSLTGKELVTKKVKLLSTMAGNFSINPRKKEYNIITDIPAAKKVYNEWPTPIVTSPFEVGSSILFPASSIENDFKWVEYHPLVIGYINYIKMPYSRQTWDLTSVLYAVESEQNYFSVSENGIMSVDENGYTSFKKQENGNHTLLSVTPEQQKRIKHRFVELITQMPQKFLKRK